MKTKGGRQSTNVVFQTDKERALAKQTGKGLSSDRLKSSEPIEYNQDPPLDEYLENMQGLRNPGNSTKAKSLPVGNKGDYQFFKHTEKDL